MTAPRIDIVLMLLSTDWFYDHWDTIGLDIDHSKRPLFHSGCRDIVKEIMSGETDYWQADFSEIRVSKTQEALTALAERCILQPDVTRRLILLTEQHDSSDIDEDTKWLLVGWMTRLAAGNLDPSAPLLDAATAKLLITAWNKIGSEEEVTFKELSLRSRSRWDGYIRSLTPDLPTYLSDFLSVVVGSTSKVDRFRTLLSQILTAEQRKTVIEWLKLLGRAELGAELRLPEIL